MRPSSTRLSARLAATALIILLAGGLAACDKAPAESRSAETGRPVLVQAVHFAPRHPARSFAGTIRPRIEADQGFRVAGKVTERLVQTGDRVKAGQPMARLDPTDFQLQMDQATAELTAARGALAQAVADETRQKTLRGNGWSSAATEQKAAAAADEARGRVTKAERALDLARNSLRYTTLTATADGVVTATGIEPGQVVAAGQMAVRVAELAQKDAVIAVPEALVDIVRRSTASVTLWSEPGHRYAARLREFAPSADAATRTYLAKFSIPDAPADMALGMTATVTLTEPDSGRVARLPLSALFSQDKRSSVFVVGADGGLSLRPVTVAAYESDSVLISDGLREGEQVVTLGVQKLDTGQKVRVMQAQS